MTGTASAPSQAIDWNQFTVRFDHHHARKPAVCALDLYHAKEVDPNSAPALTATLTSLGQDIAVGLITNIGATR